MFDIDKSSFSFFDLFAFIIPGAIALLFIKAFCMIWDTPNEGISNWVICVMQHWENGVSLISSIWFILAAYVVGHLVSFLSCITVEAYSHWRYKYPSDFLMARSRLHNKSSLRIKENDDRNPYNWVTWILKIVISLVILPISLYELLLGELFRFKYYYLKPLDRIYTDVIDDRISAMANLLKIGQRQAENAKKNKVVLEADIHRIAYHYELEKLAAHQKKLDGYIALYDFLRAVSLLSVGLFWTYLFFIFSHTYCSTPSIFLLAVLSILPYIFFIIFMKFYRRHTLETFMCLITDEDLC